jgi:hypothetical protein
MRFARTTVIFVASVLLLAGCFTGKRAHFAEAAPQVEDPAVKAVLDRLAAPTPTPYTATYNLLTRFGNIATLGTVAQSDPDTRSVTIGSVRFLEQSTGTQTCSLTTGVCVPKIDEAQVSNLSLTHDFSKISPVARLRQDSTVMTGPGVPSTRNIAGQTATCVTVSFAGGGTKEYCALDNGLLAFQDTPDLELTLLSLNAVADQGQFTTSTAAPG